MLILTSFKTTMSQIATWQNSITLFSHAVSVTDNNLKTHLNLGAALDNKGQTDDAIHQYKQALTINKSFYPAWLNLGNAYFKKEMYDKAIFHYYKALELQPNASVHCLIGISLGRTGNLKMAIHAFDKALEIHPGLEVALKNKKIAAALLKSKQK